MKIPNVPIPILKSLFSAADIFFHQRPWTIFDDRYLFGVRDLNTSEVVYCCILGNLGQVFGLCAYRGAEGFDVYQKIKNSDAEDLADDFLSIQNCLKLEFVLANELDKEDKKILKNLNIKPNKPACYPVFRSFIPKHFPWYFNEVEALIMTTALHAIHFVYSQAASGCIDLMPKPEHVLVFTPKLNTIKTFDCG
ncbi:MAG: hypothetical protein ABII23_07350 [bacterium]